MKARRWLAVAGLALVSAQAQAQDDWYVRAALGHESTRDTRFADADCGARSPAALFGCGAGSDGRTLGARGDFGSGWMGELAVGRRLAPWLRVDVAFARRNGLAFEGNANFLGVGSHQPVSADLRSTSAMLNVVIELATLGGLDSGRLQPFVSLGLGVARNRLGAMRYSFPDNPGRHRDSRTPSGSHTGLAWSVALGGSLQLAPRLNLDVAAHYTDLGKVEGGRGAMWMNHLASPIAIDRVESRLRSRGLTLGVRYAL